jgi:dTDP-4-dehydrorhamnose reductase
MVQKNLNKQKKLLILGAGGMLATDLLETFGKSKKYKIIAWGLSDLDITNEQMVIEKIGKLKPDIIINAAAYTAVDAAEKDFDKAMAVNGYALKNLAEIASGVGARLVHYSTDYVFDGKNPAGYKEGDEASPESAYGQSKFVGEQMILMTAFHNSGAGCGGCGHGHGCHKIAIMKPLNYYIIRSSWLYGKGGKNFVDTMISLAGKLPELKVVDDQRGNPTYARDLAEATKFLIEKKFPSSIYHFTNKTSKKGISWYDFAREIFKIKKIKVAVKPVTTKEFYKGNANYIAKRPAYSMLIDTKKLEARDWKEALSEYLLGGSTSK